MADNKELIAALLASDDPRLGRNPLMPAEMVRFRADPYAFAPPRNSLAGRPELRNTPPRPNDALQNALAEQISPTMGAYGMGALGAEAFQKARAGDYAGALGDASLLAAGALPGVRIKNPIRAYHGTTTPREAFGDFDLAKTASGYRQTQGGEIHFAADRNLAADYAERDSGSRLPPKELRGKGHIIDANLHAAEHDMLDFDKPLSEQGARVQDAVRSIVEQNKHLISPDAIPELPNIDGKTLFDWMSHIFGKDPAEVLRPYGVPGFVYGRSESGVPNYGVWDTSIIEKR